jgi:glycosyltransferase involved in cell wall biosynthesis
MLNLNTDGNAPHPPSSRVPAAIATLDGAGVFRHKPSLRVAIVHHWFISPAGGERVFETIAGMFPQADVFTLFFNSKNFQSTASKHKVTASFLDKIPGARKRHRHLLPFYPLAVEMLDLSGYDLVISSDSGPMKGILTDPGSTHICYCHSPMRYLWDGHARYLEQMPALLRPVFGLTSHYVRNWDYAAAQRVDHFLANSRYVATRIAKYYRRESTVIHPPINAGLGYISDKPSDYYLAVGRLVPYKRTDLLIKACTELGKKLLIVGEGPEKKKLAKGAPKNVQFLGALDDAALRDVYARCRALLFAADEDFGLVPLEAQSYGRPVIAYGKGGSLETVIGRFPPLGAPNPERDVAGLTGVFFEHQSAESLARAILAFEANEEGFSPQTAQKHARQFDTSVFVERLGSFVDSVLTKKGRPS